MKIRLDDLRKGLGLIRLAVASRTTLPVLTHVLLNVEGDELELTATNLQTTIRCKIPVVGAEGLAMTVPARLLTDYVKTLEDDDAIDVHIDEEKATLKLKSGRGEATIKGFGKDEFPIMPAVPSEGGTTFSQAALEFLIDRVIIAASTDEARPVLTGVLTEVSGGRVRMVAADGFRLSKVDYTQDWIHEGKVSALIHAPALSMLKKLCAGYPEDVVEMYPSEDRVTFRVGKATLVSSTIPGAFPDYGKIIPESHEVAVVVAPEAIDNFYRAIRTVGLFGDVLLLDVGDGKIVVKAVDVEAGEGEAELCDLEIEGSVQIGLSAKFLKEILGVMRRGQAMKILMKTPTAPVLFKQGDDFLHVLMPLSVTR